MREMLGHAYRNGFAVGGFDLMSLDFIEAIIGAAENTRSPVILSLAESHFEFYDFELAMAAAEAAAKRAAVPVAIHLDHGTSPESAVRAINHGCNSVMVDASHESLSENVALTRRVVEMAHACGVPVEGKLEYVVGIEGKDAEKHPGQPSYTPDEEARTYVELTRVDFLEVSIGTDHGHVREHPKIDFDKLKRINETLGIPLVFHGDMGLSDEQFHRLIANGVAKINCYTALADVASASIRANAKTRDNGGYTGLMNGVQLAIRTEVKRYMVVWGSAGRAAEVIAECRAWQPVEHLIIYNVEGADDAQVEAMMVRGREVLSRIPGVRRVSTGSAVQGQAKYCFSWLVQFAHLKVIDSYRDHPDHVAFANQLFRPIAGDRISIDFLVQENDGTHKQATDMHRRCA